MIEIKTAGSGDIGSIRDIAERIWWPTYTPIVGEDQVGYMLGTIYSAETLSKVMGNGSQTFLLLREDETPKGFASYGIWEEKPHTWKIHKLYVLAECHGKGFGRRMLDEIRSRAIGSGVTTLVLNVNRHNPALEFYKKYGFRVLREEDIPIGEYWMNDYVMILDL